jgi:DNA modification methylase
VVDPFLGGGTTAAAAQELGRRFIGCDVEWPCVVATKDRLAA